MSMFLSAFPYTCLRRIGYNLVSRSEGEKAWRQDKINLSGYAARHRAL